MVIILLLLKAVVISAWLVVLLRVVLSWIDPRSRTPVSRYVYAVTEPLLAPIRNVLPRTGMLDLSPLVVLLGLGILMRVLLAA
jgi:YggT family protein